MQTVGDWQRSFLNTTNHVRDKTVDIECEVLHFLCAVAIRFDPVSDEIEKAPSSENT